ncbi:MAG: hypothetical protein AAGE76_04425 [Pseudomonadota bacterium]
MTRFLLTAAALALLAGTATAQERGRADRDGPRFAHAAGDHDRRGAQRGRAAQARFARLLETYDTDGDGGVTQGEIDAARSAQLAEFDGDGDGQLTLAEYEALWLDVMRERMVDRFQAHDDNGDGAVTVAEFGEEFTRLIETRDRNGDGILNRDDFGRRAAPEAE